MAAIDKTDPAAAQTAIEALGAAVDQEFAPTFVSLPGVERIVASLRKRGYVLVNAEGLAAALATLTETPSILYPERGAAAILAAIQESLEAPEEQT